MSLREGLVEFKFLKDMEFHPLKDESYSEFFNIRLKGEAQYKTLLIEGKTFPLETEGDVENVSFTITKRDLVEPLIIYAFSAKKDTGYESKLILSPSDVRVFPDIRDACISTVDPRYYTGTPDYDYEVLSYITSDNKLCFRTSLDDFQQETFLIDVPSDCQLVKCGLGETFRFQHLLMQDSNTYTYIP